MDMAMFYKKYHLNPQWFAHVIECGLQTVHKYWAGDSTLRESTKRKIENAIHIIEKYNLVSPYQGRDSRWYSHERLTYMREFRRLRDLEEP